jgi:hypothetical protein
VDHEISLEDGAAILGGIQELSGEIEGAFSWVALGIEYEAHVTEFELGEEPALLVDLLDPEPPLGW